MTRKPKPVPEPLTQQVIEDEIKRAEAQVASLNAALTRSLEDQELVDAVQACHLLSREGTPPLSARYLSDLVNDSRLIPICIGKNCYFWVEDIMALKKYEREHSKRGVKSRIG